MAPLHIGCYPYPSAWPNYLGFCRGAGTVELPPCAVAGAQSIRVTEFEGPAAQQCQAQ
jgi:hypothetical protein